MVNLSSGREALLSKLATNDGHAENSPYFDGWKAYERNPFDPIQNPHGVIQMGLAENQVNIQYRGKGKIRPTTPLVIFKNYYT